MFFKSKNFNPQDLSTEEIKRYVGAGQTLSLETWANLTEQQKEAAERAYGQILAVQGILNAFFATQDDTQKEILAEAMKPFDGGNLDKYYRNLKNKMAFSQSQGVRSE